MVRTIDRARLMGWISRLTPYAIAMLVTGILWQSRLAESLDLILYDFISEIRPHPSGEDDPITIITISESDINAYGWPIDDRLICNAITKLSQAEVSAIGLDLYRNRGVGVDQACLRTLTQSIPELVTIFNIADDIGHLPGSPPEQRAFNDLVLDNDGVIRRDLVHVGGQDSATLSFPLRLVSISESRPELPQLIESGALFTTLSSGSGGYQDVDAAGYQQMLPYRQPGNFKQHGLQDLLNGEVPLADLQDRIVLIGSTAPSLRDQFEVPHSRFRPGESEYLMPGVEVHAHRVASLLDLSRGNHNWLIKTSANWGDSVLLLSAIAGGLLLGEAMPSLKRGSMLAGSFALIAFLIGTGLLWSRIWIGLVLPTSTLLIWAGAGFVRRGAASQQQRQQIQRLLGQTTSPAVASQLWAMRDDLLSDGRFEGRQIPVTVMFSDTCEFTKLSEHMRPADLLAWLNRGLACFIPAITERGGMVNKFTGDGFLAVFGAPVGQSPEQDAAAAIDSALAIQQDLSRLNEQLSKEGSPVMRLRIGIHSGDVLAGSMGSRERLEYAVIGDTVNCASRLESVDKARRNNDCRVLVSSTTRDMLDPEQTRQWECWGSINVKGREQPLQIWELLGGTICQAANNAQATEQANQT
ncbi:MAG: CHASE2 domain-containing protein [Prochlorococcus sp.]